ncbi:uncharacterized protein LOC123520691 isoform X1 [Portunus trituberculatus]|uniref:uncharacterized protein LOC123520691 isoform X1 n=1 Tax=Portunus trituberculatus TaxID=210409 RepID=UPI001E1CEDA9|nr:uncharacterized protein LOC123520691 isoform X1 [Portunus trituberculatus]
MASWGGAEEQELDTRNQQRAFALAGKVSALRGLALDIENEAYEHNRLLEGMGNDFSGSEGLMSGSINRVKNLLSSGRQNRPPRLARLRSVFRCPPSFHLWAGPGSLPSRSFMGGQLARRGYLHRRCWRRMGLLHEYVKCTTGFCGGFHMISLFVHIFVLNCMLLAGIHEDDTYGFQSFLVLGFSLV